MNPELEFRARKEVEDRVRQDAEIEADRRVRLDFEQRALQRQIATRLAAARQAVEAGHIAEALTLLDQVQTLAPEWSGALADDIPAEVPETYADADADRDAAEVPDTNPSSALGRSWILTAAAALAILILSGTLSSIPPGFVASTRRGPATPEKKTPGRPHFVTVRSAFIDVRAVNAPAVVPEEEFRAASTSPTLVLYPPSEPAVVRAEAADVPPPPSTAQPVVEAVSAPPPVETALAAADPEPVTREVPPPPPPPVTPPPAPEPRVPATVPPSVVGDETGIRAALRAYQRAYDRLDAGAAQAIWPAVDGRALSRAFSSLESQTIDLGLCEVTPQGATATASCRGKASYVTKVGRREKEEARRWEFSLAKSGDRWTILSATTER